MDKNLTMAEVLAKHVKMEPKILWSKITIWSTEALHAMQEYSDQQSKPLLDDIVQWKKENFDKIDTITKLRARVIELEKANEWISVEKQKPLATEAGAWDGLKSEQILVEDKNGVRYIAVMYEGTLDGCYFCNFYSSFDWEIENVINWKRIIG